MKYGGLGGIDAIDERAEDLSSSKAGESIHRNDHQEFSSASVNSHGTSEVFEASFDTDKAENFY